MTPEVWRQVVLEGDAAVIPRLAARGFDFGELEPSQGMPLLHGAVEMEHWHVVEALVRAGADIDGRDAEGAPALHLAIDGDVYDEASSEVDLPSTRRLLLLGADPAVQDAQGRDAGAFFAELTGASRRVWDEFLAATRKLKPRH